MIVLFFVNRCYKSFPAFDTKAKYGDNAQRWSDVRVVEGARLEIWCGARPHLGFESLSLRKQALPVFPVMLVLF